MAGASLCNAIPPTSARWMPNATGTSRRSPTIRGAIPARRPRSVRRRCRTPAPAPAAANVGKLGVRDVLFGGRVSYVALAVLAIIALVIGFAGGWVGRKTAEVVEAFTTSKVTLSTDSGSEQPEGRFAKVAASVADSVVTIEAVGESKVRRAPASSSTAAATSSPTTT